MMDGEDERRLWYIEVASSSFSDASIAKTPNLALPERAIGFHYF
jgi:hypothetical protein